MNFNLASSSTTEISAEAPCVYPSTPPQRLCNLSAANTPSSHQSSSPPRAPSLVFTTGSATAANTASDADDDAFPLTPNSKSSLHFASKGAGLQNPGYSPESKRDDSVAHSPSNGVEPQIPSYPAESEHGDLPHCRTTSFEDQRLFDRLAGRSVDLNASETVSKMVKDAYMSTLQDLSSASFQCVIQYLEAVRERHRMLYHAACWEVSEHARWEALARSMREDLKTNFLKAEQEVRFLLELFSHRLNLSGHPAAQYSAEFCDENRASICRADAVLVILNGAKEIRAANNCILASQKRQDRAKEAFIKHSKVNWGLAISVVGHAVGDRPNLNPIVPRRLLGSIEMARSSCSASSLVDSQHTLGSDSEMPETDQVDVEMGSGSGADYDPEYGALSIGRIPRSLDNIEPSPDDLNHSDSAIISTSQMAPLPARSRIQRILLTLRDTLKTTFNSFGVSTSSSTQGVDSPPRVFAPPYPFPTMSIYRLMSWMHSGGNLLLETKVSHLVKDVILADDFNRNDFENFSVRRNLQELDMDESGKRVTFPDDWVQTDVTIDIPTKAREDGPRPYTIHGFHYRPLVEVICVAFADVQAGAYHLLPFKRLWKDPLDGHEEQIYDELYTSDAWLEAQDDIHRLPKEPGCSLERCHAWYVNDTIPVI
ncbi:hypothetical protein EDD22DRAFT_955751 [Suillus occidentalis]|nr:hypothetical protein EDD22DRAFT_955751 [Suillus occidentalis]